MPALGLQRRSPEQAMVSTLVAYLRTQLDEDIVVMDHWAEAELPNKAVTVLMSGGADESDVNGTYVRPIDVTQPDTDPNPVYTYAIAELEQNIQIDLWAQTDADRDDMCAQLHDAIHQGYAQTLGPAYINDEPFRNGILLPCEDGITFIDFEFSGSATRENTNEAPVRREYRATLYGSARFVHTQQASIPRITTGVLQQSTSEQTASTTDTVTVTSTTFEQTSP